MGFLVFLMRASIGHNGIMPLGAPGFIKGALAGNEAGKLEYLPGDESSFVVAIRFLDDAAQFPDGQFHVLEGDARAERHSVE